MKAKPEYYRQQAKRSRDIAARMRDEDIKANLLQVAEQYDRLAEKADQK